MQVYYNIETGQRVVKPFGKEAGSIPVGHQATKPEIPKTSKELKQEAKDTLYTSCMAGVKTSVRDIVMQCSKDDIALLALSHIRSFVRDIDNVTHAVTEEEYVTIVYDVKVGYASFLINYWDTIDAI